MSNPDFLNKLIISFFMKVLVKSYIMALLDVLKMFDAEFGKKSIVETHRI